MDYKNVQKDGATGLEPVETEVEGFTVTCHTIILNLPQSLQQQRQLVTTI